MKTIQARVSDNLLQHATFMFNNRLKDLLIELFQNSRRAAATKIRVTVSETDSGTRLVLHDNGSGVKDFSTLLHLGHSDWSAETLEREHPAGIGFFALCHSGVEVKSGNQSVLLTKPNYLGDQPAYVETLDYEVEGLQLTFERSESFGEAKGAIESIGQYAGLEVYLNGDLVPAVDFLGEALFVREVNGVRIGVYPGANHCHTFNFYGRVLSVLTPEVFSAIPSINSRSTSNIHARFDVRDTKSLNLKLPDRSDVVRDELFDSLMMEGERTLYLYLATLPEHCASFKQYERARVLGVKLQEGIPFLATFCPSPYDSDFSSSLKLGEYSGFRKLIAGKIVAVDACSDSVEGADFTLAANRSYFPASCVLPSEIEDATLVDADDLKQYRGYSWANQIPVLSEFQIIVDDKPIDELAGPLVIADEIVLTCQYVVGEDKQDLRWQVSFAGTTNPSDTEDFTLAVAKASPWVTRQKEPFMLEDTAAFLSFYYHDDAGEDSFDTQLESFQDTVGKWFLRVLGGARAVAQRVATEALHWDLQQALRDAGLRELHFVAADADKTKWDLTLA